MTDYFEMKGTAEGPAVLITAGVHRDEYEPMIAANQLKSELKGLIKSGTVTFVPVVNDAAYDNNSRCGDDGLDLAREESAIYKIDSRNHKKTIIESYAVSQKR